MRAPPVRSDIPLATGRRHALTRLVLGILLAALALSAGPAEARVTVGVGVGVGVPLYGPRYYGPPPYYYRPPVYVAPPWIPPPVIYAPPPVVYPPPGYVPPAYVPPAYVPPAYVPPAYSQPTTPGLPPGFIAPPGFNAGVAPSRPQICDAGAYQCPMERPSTPDAACYCRGNDGQQKWGRVR
jgi:hypothetical protein